MANPFLRLVLWILYDGTEYLSTTLYIHIYTLQKHPPTWMYTKQYSFEWCFAGEYGYRIDE